MSELLASDSAILAFSALGLVATAISILQDARAQRSRPLEGLQPQGQQDDLAA